MSCVAARKYQNRQLNWPLNMRYTQLLTDVSHCTLCSEHLPHGANPVLQFHPSARILIAGQAPGSKVHLSGIPFADASGDRLRQWMGVDNETFYDARQIAILPMGFCYPGRGKSGDRPPRPECAATWRTALLNKLQHLELTLVIGRYALDWHLPDTGATRSRVTVTEQVRNWQQHWPDTLVLPHPSPRNNIWLKKNQWFDTEVLPILRQRVNALTQ